MQSVLARVLRKDDTIKQDETHTTSTDKNILFYIYCIDGRTTTTTTDADEAARRRRTTEGDG